MLKKFKLKKITSLLVIMVLLVSLLRFNVANDAIVANAAEVDRATGGTISASGENTPNEGAAQAFDDNSSTKWLTFSSTGWIQYKFGNGNKYAINKYTITSANDEAARDPKGWSLLGSNDGSNWTTVDLRLNEIFSNRYEKKTYTFSNNTQYEYYRLDITQNNGASIVQLAEIELLTSTDTSSSEDYIRIKNRWQETYLYENGDRVSYGTPAADNQSSHWLLEDSGDGYKRIKNRTSGEYMNIEHLYNYVESTTINSGWNSAKWIIQDYDGYKRVQNVWQYTYINIENLTGNAECTQVTDGWYSNHWIFESVDGGSTTPTPTPTPVPAGGSGKILRQYWSGISGIAISNLTSNSNYPNNPTSSEEITSFKAPVNIGDNYGTRIIGYIHPSVSGDYTFWISGDDECQLFLSTNDNPSNKSLIAKVSGWTNADEFDKYSEQMSVTKNLTAGQKYYIEALHKEGNGGDSVSVAWQVPGGSREIIPGANLSPYQVDNSTPTGSFSVSGNKIYDPNGNEFVAKGVNVNGPYWPWEREITQDANLIADVWNFNAVRVNCFPRLAYNGVPIRQDLNNIVNTFTSKGIVVIIENHDVYGTYPEANPVYSGADRYPSLQEMKDWWSTTANAYKDNDYVWYNVMNEPGLGGYSIPDSINKWKTVHDDLMTTIRNTGSNNIIVMDEHNWGQSDYPELGDTGSAVLSQGQYFTNKYSNVVFSLHMYSKWADLDNTLTNYINAAANKGLALIIGEYGAGNPGDYATTATMFNVCVNKNIGRMVWQWDGSDDYDLTTSSGGYTIDRTDGVKPGNLSWMGGLIWDDNHNSLSLPVTSPLGIYQNGDVEQGIKYWMNWGGLSAQSTDVHNGAQAFTIASGGTGGGGQFISLKPNTTYKFSAWGKCNTTPSQDVWVGVQYKVGSTSYSHAVGFTETNWTYKEVTFTTPSGDNWDKSMYMWKGDSNIQFYVDDMAIVQQ